MHTQLVLHVPSSLRGKLEALYVCDWCMNLAQANPHLYYMRDLTGSSMCGIKGEHFNCEDLAVVFGDTLLQFL